MPSFASPKIDKKHLPNWTLILQIRPSVARPQIPEKKTKILIFVRKTISVSSPKITVIDSHWNLYVRLRE